MSPVDSSDRIATLLRLAATEMSAKAFNAALGPIHEVLQLDPGNLQGYLFLGSALVGLGNTEGSVDAFRRAVGLNPQDAKSHMHLGTSLGSKYVAGAADPGASETLDESLKELRIAIRLDPNLAGAHAGMGAARMMMNDIDGAIASYREAVRLDPEFLPAHAYLALLLEMKGDSREASHHRRKADDLNHSGAGEGMPKLPTGEHYAWARGIAKPQATAKNLDALFNLAVLAVLSFATINIIRNPHDWARQSLAAVVGYFTVGTTSLLLKYAGIYPAGFHEYPVGGKVFIFDQARSFLWQVLAYVCLLSLNLREGVKFTVICFLAVGVLWTALEFARRKSLTGLPYKSAFPVRRLAAGCVWRCICLAVVIVYF